MAQIAVILFLSALSGYLVYAFSAKIQTARGISFLLIGVCTLFFGGFFFSVDTIGLFKLILITSAGLWGVVWLFQEDVLFKKVLLPYAIYMLSAIPFFLISWEFPEIRANWPGFGSFKVTVSELLLFAAQSFVIWSFFKTGRILVIAGQISISLILIFAFAGGMELYRLSLFPVTDLILIMLTLKIILSETHFSGKLRIDLLVLATLFILYLVDDLSLLFDTVNAGPAQHDMKEDTYLRLIINQLPQYVILF